MANPNIVEAGKNTRFKAGKQQVIIARKGGHTKSPRRSEAAKMREMYNRMREGKFGDKDEDWLLQRIADPDADIFHLQIWVDKVKNQVSDPDVQIRLMNVSTTLHKLKHGEKRINQNINVNIEIEKEREELIEYLNKLK
jgi:hypothetical protein